jgi:hypothetical protein
MQPKLTHALPQPKLKHALPRVSFESITSHIFKPSYTLMCECVSVCVCVRVRVRVRVYAEACRAMP